MPHDHDHGHGHDHDAADADAEVVEAAFIEGFRRATDRRGFLVLAGVPFEIDGRGAPGWKLIEVRIDEGFTVGAASPGFGSGDLVYHPLPGGMVSGHAHARLVYVSAVGRHELTLAEALAARG